MQKINHDEFTQNLILVMLGAKLESFNPLEQDQVVVECLEIYNHYIQAYFTNHFPEVDLKQIGILDFTDSNNKSITIGIAQKIEEAYESFVTHLEESWNQA